MCELDGRVGIVTGASSGIGYSIANVLAESGAKVYAISRSGKVKDPNAKIASGIIEVQGDVCDYNKMKEIIDQIGYTEGIDFLVNNAGITIKCRAEEFLDEDFERIHKVNVNSVFKLSCQSYPYLKKSASVGRIVNITSMAAHLGFSEVVPYCSSKGAVLAMTKGLAVEWAEDNITVNSIAPGWFPSEMSVQVMTPERREKILNRMPLHKFGDTRDIGAMVQFLLSKNARYISGQDFAVDGGALAYGF